MRTPMTVPVERILPHPHNSNKLPQRDRDRIRRFIASDHDYPRLIVRSLGKSVEFAEQHALGKLQLLDGEHRLGILVELGLTEVDVDCWGDLTDAKALLLLATLNHGGQDDPMLRAALVARIVSTLEEDADRLELFLPESAGDIRKMCELSPAERKLVSFAAGSGGGKKDETKGTAFCFQVFVPSRGQDREIRKKLNDWLAANDPDRQLPYRDGVALLALLGIGV